MPTAKRRAAALIVRRDGRDAMMGSPEQQGWYRAGDMHVCHFVLYRESDQVGLCLVTIQISGTAAEILRAAPLAQGEELQPMLDLVAECALGDFLDGLKEVPRGQHTPQFYDSARIEELLARPPVRESEAIRYLAAKAYWATKLHQHAAGFRKADSRRIGLALRDLRIVADTYTDQWWTYMADPHPDVFYLKASQALLQRGPRMLGPAVAGPVFDISDYLASAPLEASAQQFRKALAFLTGERPDYENAIKEAVGAVESRARQMTGESTLGRAADALRDTRRIPRSLARLLTALWEYRSSMPAVGHGGLKPADTEIVEARAMVNSCASALLYLLEVSDT